MKTSLFAALVVLASVLPALADPPTLAWLYPAGASRGECVEVRAGGLSETWPVEVDVQGRGVTVEPGEEAGSLVVSVDADAPLGTVWIRLYNGEGASHLRPFLVGRIPEVLEVEPNDDPAAAQRVDLPSVTVNGRLGKPGDVDGYAVDLEAGQTLVASMLAHNTIGSPMDATLQVATPEGFVLAHVDDDQGIDPRLIFAAPTSGTFVVRTFAFPVTPDSSIRFAGGDAFVYRLTLTTAGFVDHTRPLVLPRDTSGPVSLVGWNLPDEVECLSVDEAEEGENLSILEHQALAHAVEVPRIDHDAIDEVDNDASEDSGPLTAPVTISGCIDSPGDRDAYAFEFKHGEPRIIRVEARILGSPLDPILRILDEDGAMVAENDDANSNVRDSELSIDVPRDGIYQVEVGDLNHRGGFRYMYRLDVLSPVPDARLSIKSDRFVLKADEPVEIVVDIERLHGFQQDVEITLDRAPQGVTVEPATSKLSGDSAKAVTLRLTSTRACGWSGLIQITGRSGEWTRSATFALDDLDTTTDQGWLTVIPIEEDSEKVMIDEP